MWLIRRTLAGIVILIALTGLARFIGHQQPLAPQIRAWRLDECAAPCWMGITPGQSTVPEAYKQTAAVLHDFGYTLDPLTSSWNDLGIFLKIRDDLGHVDQDAIISFVGQTNFVDEFGIWRGRT